VVNLRVGGVMKPSEDDRGAIDCDCELKSQGWFSRRPQQSHSPANLQEVREYRDVCDPKTSNRTFAMTSLRRCSREASIGMSVFPRWEDSRPYSHPCSGSRGPCKPKPMQVRACVASSAFANILLYPGHIFNKPSYEKIWCGGVGHSLRPKLRTS